MREPTKISFKLPNLNSLVLTMLLCNSNAFAQEQTYFENMKSGIQSLIKPKEDHSFSTVQLKELSNFDFEPDAFVGELPVVMPTISGQNLDSPKASDTPPLTHQVALQKQYRLDEIVKIAVMRNPTIAQSVASLASQNANIDVVKSQYYPQLRAGVNSGDFTSGNRNRQVYNVEASQLLYDFGKVGASVDTEKARLALQQATVLIAIDDIATQTTRSLLGVLRYRELVKIADQQLKGVSRLYDIALLRARAGISSNADPVQALSYVEFAKSYLIVQQNLLKQEEQKLRTLLGFPVERIEFSVPTEFVLQSGIDKELELNTIPSMIAAKAEIDVAREQKHQNELSRYPTVSLVGSVSKALNGDHPSTGKRNDLDSALSVSMSSNFYQGGAVSSQIKAASFAEQAARSKLNAAYLDVLDVTRTARENINNTEKQMAVLKERENSTAKTKELYEEQYKLGKRSILDLLSSEQSFHSSKMEWESARYSIYDTIATYIYASGKSRDVYQLNNTKIQGFEVQP